MSLDDVSEGYRLVLDGVIKTSKQTQTILPDQKASGPSAIPEVRATIVLCLKCPMLKIGKIPKSSVYEKVVGEPLLRVGKATSDGECIGPSQWCGTGRNVQ